MYTVMTVMKKDACRVRFRITIRQKLDARIKITTKLRNVNKILSTGYQRNLLKK